MFVGEWAFLKAIISFAAITSFTDPVKNEFSADERNLEEIAIRILEGSSSREDSIKIMNLSENESQLLNIYLDRYLGPENRIFELDLEDEIIPVIFDPILPQSEQGDGCPETIACFPLKGYTYHLPYTFWYRDEGWFDDLMLEYEHWTNDGRKRPKAFYISDFYLWMAMQNCGIVVEWEAMEGKKQRVTAVVGWSIWAWWSPGRVICNARLGFAP